MKKNECNNNMILRRIKSKNYLVNIISGKLLSIKGSLLYLNCVLNQNIYIYIYNKHSMITTYIKY
jgi:hypothetical protein